MSVARLEVVQGMELIPHACVLCANNPADENTGEQLPAIFAPGVDVDWGSSVYICYSCAGIIADLIDRPDGIAEKYMALEKKHKQLKADHDKAKDLLDRIAEGRAAVKQAKQEARA